MAATHSSSSSAGGAMKATMVLMLLLTAVASAHGAKPNVSCENKGHKPVWANGNEIGPGLILFIEVDLDIVLKVIGKDDKEYTGKYSCPADVTAVVVLYDGLYVKLKVKAVSLIFGLLNTVIGLVLGLAYMSFIHG